MGGWETYLVAVDELEDFGVLLDSLPRTGARQWREAAKHQLRGKRLDEIAVELAPGLSAPPYVVSDRAATSAGRFPGERFVGISDLRDLPEPMAADVLAELEGGAQGLWLAADALRAEALAEVRFDFVTTVWDSASPPQGVADELASVVPAAQRGGARVWCPVESAGAGSLLAELREGFPEASVVVTGSRLSSETGALASLGDYLANLADALGAAADRPALARALVLRVPVGPSYPRTLVELRALKVLFANLCAHYGLSEPFPALRIWAEVAPPTGTLTAERYLIDAGARAVAAATCGLAGLTVRPFPAAGGDAVHRRRARNIPNVLEVETAMQEASDVLAGAAWVESAAEALGRAAWERFSPA